MSAPTDVPHLLENCFINFLKQYDLGLMLFDDEISTIRTEATLGHNNNA